MAVQEAPHFGGEQDPGLTAYLLVTGDVHAVAELPDDEAAIKYAETVAESAAFGVTLYREGATRWEPVAMVPLALGGMVEAA